MSSDTLKLTQADKVAIDNFDSNYINNKGTILKIIFCDIDNVLNSPYYRNNHPNDYGYVERRKVNNLRKIIDKTNAIVVIISKANTLLGKEYDELRVNQIREFGVNPVDSITSIGHRETKSDVITRWLNEHSYSNANYIVIDDSIDNINEEMMDNFIHITGKYGLTMNHVTKAVDKLNK